MYFSFFYVGARRLKSRSRLDLVCQQFLTTGTRNARPYVIVSTKDKKFNLSQGFRNNRILKRFD
jgi:hypothetical protein